MISEFMSQEHKRCDDLFTHAENALETGDRDTAKSLWTNFCEDLNHHLNQEENVLFPAFEAKTGMTAGPTAVMRAEHQQMRTLCADIATAFDHGRDPEEIFGQLETFMILMQQHNMKEEQILYPMTDQHLDSAEDVLNKIKSL